MNDLYFIVHIDTSIPNMTLYYLLLYNYYNSICITSLKHTIHSIKLQKHSHTILHPLKQHYSEVLVTVLLNAHLQ